MRIHLSKQSEATIQHRLAIGLNKSVDEVIDEALAILANRDMDEAREHEELKLAIQKGLEGPFTPWDREEIIEDARLMQ